MLALLCRKRGFVPQPQLVRLVEEARSAAGAAGLVSGGEGDLVPSAGRRFGRDCLFRLAFGDEGFDALARRGQLLLVEMGSDVEDLLAGVLVATLGGEREPLVGFDQIAIDADAARIEDGE